MWENIHEIEFRRKLCVVLERSKKRAPQLLQVTRGSRFRVRLVPYHKGRNEVADLYFTGGGVAREVSFSYFAFVDEPDSVAETN